MPGIIHEQRRVVAFNIIRGIQLQQTEPREDQRLASPGALANRVLTENRAKAHLYDVLQLRSLLLNSLQKEQAIMRYYSPQRKFLREAFYDKRGYVNSAFATPMVFVFNKKLVSREEAPKSMSDQQSLNGREGS